MHGESNIYEMFNIYDNIVLYLLENLSQHYICLNTFHFSICLNTLLFALFSMRKYLFE